MDEEDEEVEVEEPYATITPFDIEHALLYPETDPLCGDLIQKLLMKKNAKLKPEAKPDVSKKGQPDKSGLGSFEQLGRLGTVD